MKIVFETREFIEKAWGIAESISIDGNAATQFKGAMFYSTLNICDAMQLLIHKRNFVSSNILFRSLLEYVFRAYWLSRVASENEISQAMADEWPKTRNLHELIAGKNSIIDLLASEKLKIKGILNSYIHGGSQNPLGQLGNSGYIEPNIPDSEVSYLLHVILLSTYVTLSEMAHLSGADEIEAEIVKIVEELVRELP
ncbi:DUF6988 family protein [Neptuniibacter sp. PT8_73]|uniref:DUF6988 family protein n=1 Tax=Neptuniibacter sp. PT8_73 TaxID=3398206 RepID=UPI0039F4A56B